MKRGLKFKNNKSTLAITTWVVIFVVGFCAWFVWYQLNSLEDGIMEVCATQQDAYVQLVLDQINLKENRDDEEIIRDILSTLDSSSKKYWTFSKDRSMLFVKDIIETNRYKGLTTASYYDSESARSFLDSLMIDRVIHQNIIIDGKEYVASGVAFKYDEDDYRLCLLTNKDVILNNNKFMGAKLEMIIFIAFVLIGLMAVAILFARRLEQAMANVKEKEESIEKLQGMVGQLNEMLCQKEHYDTRYQLWSKESIKDFLDKLKAKGIEKVFMVRINCIDDNNKNYFLEKASVLLDKRVLRFVLSDSDIMLLYIRYNENDVVRSLETLLNEGVKATKQEELVLSRINPDDYMHDLGVEV